MKVSLIGLGAMGFPMARHLAKDHEVTVWNRTSAVAERHAREHGTLAAAELALCAGVDSVITVLPTSREVDLIVDQLIETLPSGALWIDATSGDPVSARATAARLGQRGVAYVDAPVSGGTVGAEAGTLTVMAGGSEGDFSRAASILRSCASKILHVGPIGAGHTIKAITNTMMAANMWIAAEAIVALERLGFDTKVSLDAINGASGRSNVTENLLPRRLIEKQWPLLFKLSLLDKDARIASDILQREHLSTPMLALTSQFYAAALRELGKGADYVEVVRYVGTMNGVEFE